MDELLRVRLSAFSESFVADLMYHFHVDKITISNLNFDPKEAKHLQNMTYSEVTQMFFKKVDQINFAVHEIWSLQLLLN